MDMNTTHSSRCFLAWALAAISVLLLGCLVSVPAQDAVKKIEVGKNVFVELRGKERRVLVQGYVCLRMGQLEQLFTRKRTKEHESILAAEVDAKDIHTALIACGAEAGKPVSFAPKFTPASGTTIKVFVEYKDKDKMVRRPAQEWIRSIKTKKQLEQDWVFAGSRFFQDPLDKTKKPFYMANDGDVICISNFETAMLDLPISSTKDNDDLYFEAHTDRIPPVETPVTIILEPLLKK
jgi:hypothetical protein